MKLFHGSSKKVRVLKPQQAKGLTKFQNLKAVFLTKSFKQAALYSLGKQLRGKTGFGVNKKLCIIGNFKLRIGYVYEFDLEEGLIKGTGKYDEGIYAVNRELRNFKLHKIKPEDYEKDIEYVSSKEELRRKL